METEFIVNPDKELSDTIYQGLYRYNMQHFPEAELEKVACVARNENGEVVGGLTGQIFTNTLFVEYLWVDENSRTAGIGSRIMQQAEQAALEKGVTDIYLDTYSFQARDFYLKLGFHEVGQYTGFPVRGIDKIFLQKNIA